MELFQFQLLFQLQNNRYFHKNISNYLNSNNKIESLSGTFTKVDEFVGGMTSYYEGDILKLNYHGINPMYHDEIFAIAKATLVDIDAKYVG